MACISYQIFLTHQIFLWGTVNVALGFYMFIILGYLDVKLIFSVANFVNSKTSLDESWYKVWKKGINCFKLDFGYILTV